MENSIDGQTLFISFKKELPSSEDEVRFLHPAILSVRCPRRGKKGDQVKCCLLKFETKEVACQAKLSIATNKFRGESVYVDFVKVSKGKKIQKLNPCKLFVSGLTPGVTNAALKSMFPKASYAEISRRSRKKGSKYGFVFFSNPKDARATFDAAQNLDIEGHKITVLYAKDKGDNEENVLKRKANLEKMTKNKKAKTSDGEIVSSDGEDGIGSDEDSDADNEESNEVNAGEGSVVDEDSDANEENDANEEGDEDDESNDGSKEESDENGTESEDNSDENDN